MYFYKELHRSYTFDMNLKFSCSAGVDQVLIIGHNINYFIVLHENIYAMYVAYTEYKTEYRYYSKSNCC